MIWRVDLLLWGAAAALVVAAGLMRLVAFRRPSALVGPAVQMILSAVALLALVFGVVWRSWAGLAPSEAGTASALAAVAAGALACGLWQDRRERRRDLPDVREHQAAPHAVALFGAALLILMAVVAGWRFPVGVLASPTAAWLYSLRDLTAGLGLGGWLFMAAAALYAGVTFVRQRWFRGPEPGLFHPSPDGPDLEVDADGEGERFRPGAQAAHYAAPVTHPARNLADAALRFSYPWLTIALVAGGVWSLAVYATPWRGRPSELWLSVTWLLGGAYLHAVAGWRTPRQPRLWASILALIGLLTGLLAVWQVPTLFT